MPRGARHRVVNHGERETTDSEDWFGRTLALTTAPLGVLPILLAPFIGRFMSRIDPSH